MSYFRMTTFGLPSHAGNPTALVSPQHLRETDLPGKDATGKSFKRYSIHACTHSTSTNLASSSVHGSLIIASAISPILLSAMGIFTQSCCLTTCFIHRLETMGDFEIAQWTLHCSSTDERRAAQRDTQVELHENIGNLCINMFTFMSEMKQLPRMPSRLS